MSKKQLNRILKCNSKYEQQLLSNKSVNSNGLLLQKISEKSKIWRNCLTPWWNSFGSAILNPSLRSRAIPTSVHTVPTPPPPSWISLSDYVQYTDFRSHSPHPTPAILNLSLRPRAIPTSVHIVPTPPPPSWISLSDHVLYTNFRSHRPHHPRPFVLLVDNKSEGLFIHPCQLTRGTKNNLFHFIYLHFQFWITFRNRKVTAFRVFVNNFVKQMFFWSRNR